MAGYLRGSHHIRVKSLHRNIIPATAIPAGGTLTSQIQKATKATGIRFYVTVAGATTGSGTDALFICGVPPALTQGNPDALKAAPAIQIAGLASANALSVNGIYAADLYPGAWQAVAPGAPGGALLGMVGIALPMFWAVRIVLGTGNAATITVDGEYLM